MAATEQRITENEAGQRLDNYLFKVFKGIPNSRIYRAIRKGEVRINGGRCQAITRLHLGDKVRIPPLRPVSLEAVVVPQAMIEQIQHAILYEDDDLLVINKPTGLGSQGGTDIKYSVIDCFRSMALHYQSVSLVHRLDKATSGCLVLAKNRTTLVQLHNLWQQGAVHKTYWAVVAGAWSGDERCVTDKLARRESKTGPKVVVDNENGKEAQTEFAPIARYPTQTIVTAHPLTGRMHQIRCHAASIGHPIWGDDKYGDFSLNRKLRDHGLDRLCLHAWKIAFIHPRLGTPLEVIAPIDQKMAELAKTFTS